MTTTDFDASKLEPGAPELEHGSSSESHAVMAYSQAVSLKRIADAMTANTEQHDRVAAEKRADAAEQQRGYWFKAWRVIIDGVIGPRPMCRDCADEAGTCPTRDGLPCDPSEDVVERFRRLTARAEAAEKRLAEVEAREQELAEALEELIDTLTPAEQVPSKDPAYGDEVRALGARIGFAALCIKRTKPVAGFAHD